MVLPFDAVLLLLELFNELSMFCEVCILYIFALHAVIRCFFLFGFVIMVKLNELDVEYDGFNFLFFEPDGLELSSRLGLFDRLTTLVKFDIF